MDELHIRDPGIPQVLNFFGKGSIAKGSELCSTLLEPSRIEETHATQELVPANPVYCVKETALKGERTLTFLSTNGTRKMLFRPKSQNVS